MVFKNGISIRGLLVQHILGRLYGKVYLSFSLERIVIRLVDYPATC